MITKYLKYKKKYIQFAGVDLPKDFEEYKDAFEENLKNQIKDHLEKKQEVQQFTEVKKSKKKQGHITANQPNAQWQIDIYYLQKYYKSNHNYKYILACVDIFTRKAYAIPMKLREDKDVYNALLELFKIAKTTPYVITSDSDPTFNSKETQIFIILC
jgi:hypothetical protein